VPKVIKHAMVLERENGDRIWEDAIKTALKQLTDYQTFRVMHSREAFHNDYQMIPYHIMFDVKYDLRH
jgi:hypothetical protein